MMNVCFRFSCVVIAILCLVGCDSEPKNPDQIAFMTKIKDLEKEKSRLDIIAFRGTDESGRVAPADIKSQVERIEQEILQLLKSPQHEVTQWKAVVRVVQRKGSELLIRTAYGSQYYDLRIFDASAIKIAEQFREDEKISFSGNLGPETSVSLFGALTSQDFSLYPTSIASKYGELTQPPSEIAARHQQTKATLAEQEKQRRRNAQEEEIKDTIIALCKNTLRSSLKYPESASFSWFKRNFIKRSETQWTYYDVLEAKNDFGGTLPSRFECDATLADGQIEVNVRLID